MNKIEKKQKLLQRRRWSLRKRVAGTAERPRLVVKFTNIHIHAQLINDETGITLVGSSTMEKSVREQKLLPNVNGATQFGSLFAEKVKASGVSSIVFDRAGRKYHGVVKAFAEALRQAGIQF